jgi:hypothetical protein
VKPAEIAHNLNKWAQQLGMTLKPTAPAPQVV